MSGQWKAVSDRCRCDQNRKDAEKSPNEANCHKLLSVGDQGVKILSLGNHQERTNPIARQRGREIVGQTTNRIDTELAPVQPEPARFSAVGGRLDSVELRILTAPGKQLVVSARPRPRGSRRARR